MHIIIRQPENEQEWKDYYHLRWRILRAPWGEAEGSEKDDMEDRCFHVIACNDKTMIGIGRLQFNSDTEAQIRYMAVEPEYERKGIGRKIITALERYAGDKGYQTVMLHARENAVGFYRKMGYEVIQKSYVLFDRIQHYQMQKQINAQYRRR